MNTITINVCGDDYEIKFGFAADSILTTKWKFKTLGQVHAHIGKNLNFKEGKEPEVKQLSVLGDLIHAGILSKQKNAKIDRDDCVDYVLNNVDQLGAIVQLYVASQPKTPEQSKNANRVK